MLTFCLEASQNQIVMALIKNEAIVASRKSETAQTSDALLWQIDELFKQNSNALSEVNKIILGIGPGSFTSLRVAAVSVWGLFGFTKTLPEVWGVSSLRLRLLSLPPEQQRSTCVAFAARQQKIYAGWMEGEDFVEACLTHDDLLQKYNEKQWQFTVGLGLEKLVERQVTLPLFLPDVVAIESFLKIDLKLISYKNLLNQNINLNYLQPKEDIAVVGKRRI